MNEYCKIYGEFGERKKEACPNYIHCRFHPVPNYCEAQACEQFTSVLEKLLEENKSSNT